MKSTLQAYLRKQQYKSVGPAFDELAKLDLPEYPEWRTFAEHGQAAADKRDEVAVKQACKGCHDAYRARYRKERRDRPVF